MSNTDKNFKVYLEEKSVQSCKLIAASLAFNSVYLLTTLPVADFKLVAGTTALFTLSALMASCDTIPALEGGRKYHPDFPADKKEIIEQIFAEKKSDVAIDVGVINSQRDRGIAKVNAEKQLIFNDHYMKNLDDEAYETVVRHELSHIEYFDIFQGALFGAISYAPAFSCAVAGALSKDFKHAGVGAAVMLGQFVLNREFSVNAEERAFVQSTLRNNNAEVDLEAVNNIYAQLEDVERKTSPFEVFMRKHFPTHPTHKKISNALEKHFS